MEKPKADIAGLTYPFYSLSSCDRVPREYEFIDERNGNNTHLSVTPPPVITDSSGRATALGRATIDDKDLIIYAMTLALTLHKEEKPINVIHFTMRDFLRFCGKKAGGAKFQQIIQSLERLKWTEFRTNIITNNYWEQRSFSLVSEYAVKQVPGRGGKPNISIELHLCQWLQNAVIGREVLVVDMKYFELRPIEKRLFEIARKFCGRKASWSISLEKLQNYIGNFQPAKYIRAQLAIANLPGFKIELYKNTDGRELVRFSKSTITEKTD